MKVYFVRHGEGDHNVRKLYSHPDFSLTEKGKLQAKIAAERIKSLPIEIIISSTFKRTMQTTEVINKHLKKEVIYSDLVTEIRRPSEIAGKFQGDPEVIKIKNEMDKKFHLPNWRYSDEENFYDFKKRALDFIKYLESLNYEHILVVTHLVFIQAVVLAMMLKENLNSEILLRAYRFLEIETSGLTICENKNNDWHLITWNDHAHLAENNNAKFQG
ncbi:histidine phosphatase family protein [Candidatus Daviesbacteria bacterium]|nr:histidine phosphatase family protein [Candidatus Daviesbacteria bacterium]